MFSPLESESLDNWFQRLNAPLKRLPLEERTQLHLEVRQHLDALAAANEELGSSPEEAWEHALAQFGEPGKFGKRMAWEWRRKHGFVGPQIASILYGMAVCSLSLIALAGVNWLVMALPYYTMNIILVSNPFPVYACGILVIPVVTGAAVGRRYPHQAASGSLYAAFLWPSLPGIALFLECLRAGLTSLAHIDLAALEWVNFAFMCLAFPLWLSLTCGAAYLASVTKRGWYRPTLNDFKLTLPRRRALTYPATSCRPSRNGKG